MSLLQRLTLAIFAVLLLFAINVVTFATGNHTIRESLDAVSDAIRGQVNAGTVRQGMDALHKKLLVFVTLRDSTGEIISEQEARQAQFEVERIRELVRAMTKNTNAESYADYEQLLGNAELLFRKWDRLLQQLRGNTQHDVTIDELKSLYRGTSAALERFERAVMSVSRAQSSEVERTGKLIGRVTILIFLLSIFLTSILGFILIRHTKQALGRLREGTERVGGGDLEYKIPVESRDEFGELATAFNDMAARLGEAVAEVQAARENADRANAAKSSFLANMSHELRTPLNAIIGYSEMLVEMTEDDAEVRAAELSGDLQRIRTAGSHLLALINDVLDLSKIETGRMTLHIERFDTVEVLRELIATMHTLARHNRNSLALECECERLEIVSDQTRFRQIFSNLIGNACKFTHRGEVRVRVEEFAREELPWVRVSVSDTGIGMSAAQLDTVFEAFVQADSSTTKKYGGTGLGLALSREFATLLGGSIVATSEEDKGSCFGVELPVDAAAVAAARARASETAVESEGAGGLRSTTVLVIDDDPDARELTARALRRQNRTVLLAESGSQGLQLARERRPDLIVLDLVMPGMDGWEVLSVLKDSEETRDIPVVLQSMLDAREEALQRGAVEFLDKPVNRHRLAETIERIAPDGGGQLLLIESASAAREELSAGLGEQGWLVSCTEQSAEALALARQTPPDLVLLSLELPSEDVFALADEFGSNERLRNVPVYVLAGTDEHADARERLEAQIDRLVIQPRSDVRAVLDQTARLRG